MKRTRQLLISLVIAALLLSVSSARAARIKDIAGVAGVRENQLIGYGLVVGLNKTGDNYNNTRFSIQTLVSMLEKLGTTVDISRLRDLRVKNIAAVMTTATLPPFARPGMKIDVSVSSLGDARSLAGGTLLLTPLKGANGAIYAVAQGAISVGGAFQVRGKRNKFQKNHSTVGKIPSGALVERGVPVSFVNRKSLDLLLNRPDFTTAVRVSEVINGSLGADTAHSLDGGTVRVSIPPDYQKRVVELIAKIEILEIAVDTPAKIVLDERTGTIVIGENVKLSASAISHGDLIINIKETVKISQPAPVSGGTTVVTAQEEIVVKEKKNKLLLIPSTATISDLAEALNAIGVTTRDLIAIFQSLKAAGALQAELEII